MGKGDTPDPAARLLGISIGLLRARMLHAVAELGIADLLKDGPMTAGALAQRAGADTEALYRILRALSASGVFAEREERRFELNETAQLLRSDRPDSVRDLVLHMAGDWHVRTVGELLHSVRTGEPAFEKAHGISFFEWMKQNEEAARRFDSAMAKFAASGVAAAIEAYDFSRFERIVDLGGGNGELLRALLERHAQLRGVLLDLPHVIESARKTIDTPALASRIELVAGDFFAAVPRDGDAYVLKNVIHNWDDARAAHILRLCRDAMRADGRVLLIENPILGPNQGAFAKVTDVGMLLTLGGRERMEQEYAQLFEASGLRLARVIPTASPVSVIEATR